MIIAKLLVQDDSKGIWPLGGLSRGLLRFSKRSKKLQEEKNASISTRSVNSAAPIDYGVLVVIIKCCGALIHERGGGRLITIGPVESPKIKDLNL